MVFVNPTTFIKEPPKITETDEAFHEIKETLSGRIFLGFYKERRFVPVLNAYRDVVEVSCEETELQHDLESIRRKCLGIKEIKWVGITGPDMAEMSKAYCFWVKLTNLPFGHYWFQIKNIKFINEEIILHLKCIRKSQAPGSIGSQMNLESCNQRNETPETGTLTKIIPMEYNWDFDWKNITDFIIAASIKVQHTVAPHLTWENFFSVIRLTCCIIGLLVMGIILFVVNFGKYLLKLLREVTLLINALAPIIIQLIDCFSKIVGGFYILLAGIFLRKNQGFDNSNSRSIPFSPPVDWRERNQLLRESFYKNIR